MIVLLAVGKGHISLRGNRDTLITYTIPRFNSFIVMDLEEKTASGDYKYPQHFSRACVDRSGESMHLAEEALKAEKYTSGVDCVRGVDEGDAMVYYVNRGQFMKKAILDRDVQGYESTTDGSFSTKRITPQAYRKIAFRLQKVKVQKKGSVWTFSCVCKRYWHHCSCSHGRFVAIVVALGAPERPLPFTATSFRSSAHGRKRSATPALTHQPADAEKPSEGGSKKQKAPAKKAVAKKTPAGKVPHQERKARAARHSDD